MPKSKSKRVKRQPPPKAKHKKSPIYIGALFFTFLFTGVFVIIANYVNLLPVEVQNWALFYGLGLIAASFGIATRWY